MKPNPWNKSLRGRSVDEDNKAEIEAKSAEQKPKSRDAVKKRVVVTMTMAMVTMMM